MSTTKQVNGSLSSRSSCRVLIRTVDGHVQSFPINADEICAFRREIDTGICLFRVLPALEAVADVSRGQIDLGRPANPLASVAN